jgi:hypothetical protein
MSSGLGKPMKNAVRMPRQSVLDVLGLTGDNNFYEFRGALYDHVDLKGYKITDKLPLKAFSPELRKALKLSSPVSWTSVIKKCYN